MDTIRTVNPATGVEIATYATLDADGIEAALARAWTRYTDDWSRRALDDRLEVIAAAAKVLDARREDLAALMTAEMGKPIAAARNEVDKCAWLCRHFVDAGPGYLQRDEIDTDALRSYVRYDPLGPILAVMPWNFPLWQVFRFLVPNIAAGNVGLLKHASNVTGTALEIQQILLEAGAPEDTFTTLLIGHGQVEQVIADPRVRGATVTGSEAAGRAVAEAAGRNLKKSVMELGGSDPFIVRADADLVLAASLAADSRFLNSGQSCINAKRMIVHAEVHEEFLEAFLAEVDGLNVGNPTDETTDVGPIAREDLREQVHDQVVRTREHHDGGRILRGGEMPDGQGFYYPATVIDGLSPEAPAAAEEVFGPVAAVMSAPDDDALIALANATRFGLGAAIITRDLEAAERMATRIEAGMVFVNQLVKSDPRLPFGGVKDSGYGRELAGPGAREFLNARTVWVDAAD